MSTNAQISTHGKIVEEYIAYYSSAAEALQHLVGFARSFGFDGAVLITEGEIVFSWSHPENLGFQRDVRAGSMRELVAAMFAIDWSAERQAAAQPSPSFLNGGGA